MILILIEMIPVLIMSGFLGLLALGVFAFKKWNPKETPKETIVRSARSVLLDDLKMVFTISAMLIGFFGAYIMVANIEYRDTPSWSVVPKEVLQAQVDAVKLDKQGNLIQRGYQVWCWDIWRGVKCIGDLPVSMDVESRVSPITENPKVRNLVYVVRTRLTDPRAYAAALSLNDDGKNIQRASDAVLSELYEFNNAQSKTLANFYNPKDARQTNALAELLKREINPRLKSKGMEITELVSWEVE